MKRKPILLLAALAFLLASCGGNKAGLAVPKDAALVFHINSSSLASKLSWEDIRKSEWYKDVQEQAKGDDSLAQRIINDPEASGVDVKSDFVFFIKRQGKGGYTMLEGGVKDSKAFAALVQKVNNGAAIKKDGDWNVATSGNSAAIWNDKKFGVIADMPMAAFNPMGGMKSRASTRFTADSLTLFARQVMTMDSDDGLYDDDRFAGLMKETGDMHLWFNTGRFYGSDMMGMMSMMKASVLFEDNISAGTMNFDDGKMTFKGKQFYNKEMQQWIEKMQSKDVSADVLARIPANPLGVMAANFDPEAVREFMKLTGFDGVANSTLAQVDMTLDEVVSAFKGDFLFSFSDLQMKDTTYVYPNSSGEPFTIKTKKPDATYFVAASVNKKQTFEQLLSLVPKEQGELPFVYKINNDWFAGSNRAAATDAFLAGTKANHPWIDKIKGHPFGMYVDIQRILQTNFSDDALAKEGLAEAAKVWKDMVAVGYKFKDGVAESEFTVNMVDGKTNSLKQLNAFMEKMNAIRKKSIVNRNMNNDMMIDSATAVPAMPMAPVEEAPRR